jgi:hypothetical protein
MASYGNAFDFTPEELTASLISMNKARLPGAGMWALGTLRNQLQEPQNIAMSEALGAPFAAYQAVGPSFSVPSGVLGSALRESLPSTMASSQTTATQLQDNGKFAGGLLGSQLAAIKAGENIPAPVSPAITGEGWVDIEPDVNVNSPEVQDLIRMAKAASAQTGQRLTITSGIEPRAAGSLQHPAGVAIDLRAYSPVTGAGLANYQSPETFSQYESVAQAMRAAQQANFPQYKDTFRWGGYFSGGPEKYGALDLMHFDVNNPRGYGMAGGSFESGLTPEMRKTWGITAPTAGTPSGPITVAASPSPVPVRAVMPQTATVSNAGLLGGAGRDGGQIFAAAPAASTDAFRAANLGSQILANAQPQVVDDNSAPEAPPVVRPAGEPTRLASLLIDRAMARSDERRRRKRSTTSQDTMTDTIGGLLA